ncbi:MAG: NAD-dependent DNA ligase LigA [Candidatus Gracilibacteria bacterium]|nr:NAD-dependent DNA ligase LigA [Candidatus Gracilibacteria bacterium]
MTNKLELSKKYLNTSLDNFNLEDVKTLAELIEYHSDLYYNKEEPIISDYEYDELFKKLTLLEEKFGVSKKQTEKIGAELQESTFAKVKHSRPMISLDNTYNEEDLRDFDERVKRQLKKESILSSLHYEGLPLEKEENKEQQINLPFSKGVPEGGGIIQYTIEFKFDGLGVELIYKDGELKQAITRGNGVEGEDVTVNIMQIDNIPKKIEYKKHLEVRGEVVMPISVFHDLNEIAKKAGTKIFSNPRNAASGSVRMKDCKITKQRRLKFFAYDLANFDEFRKAEGIESYFQAINDLGKLGFEISTYFKKLNSIDDVIKSIDDFGDLKKTLDFEIDGLVLKVNDIGLWEQIGWTQHHPRYAIAYKFPAEILTTRILSVEHSVGRTGTITPVANLEHINIGGVIVKRATLHNYEEVENLDARVGDTVFIKRAGEVIPKIISVVKEGFRDDFEKITPPEFCPSCETKVQKDEDKVRYYCPNKVDCPAQHHEMLTFAVGKQGFNIDGLGERQVELFLDLGIIQNLSDIFNIKEKRDDILALEGFQEKSVNNLIEAVENAKHVDIATLLTAIGISGVGKKTAKTLSKLFHSKDDLLNFTRSAEELEELEDIGPEIARSVISYFEAPAHKRLLEDLVGVLDIKYYIPLSNSLPEGERTELYGKKVCITGSFEGYTRDELIEKLESVGGEFISAVSKKTDFLLAGEKAGSKLKKAQEFGVKVISLEEFLEMLR